MYVCVREREMRCDLHEDLIINISIHTAKQTYRAKPKATRGSI